MQQYGSSKKDSLCCRYGCCFNGKKCAKKFRNRDPKNSERVDRAFKKKARTESIREEE